MSNDIETGQGNYCTYSPHLLACLHRAAKSSIMAYIVRTKSLAAPWSINSIRIILASS